MDTLVTVLVALILPVAWGLLSAWLFDRVRLRRECPLPNEKPEQERKGA